MQYFYDHQIRRFLLQFIRYFTGFQVEYGKDANGNPIYVTVPVRYADNNRSVASILKNNSENSVSNVPMMVVYIDNLKYHRSHIQSPTYTEQVNIRELAVDPLTGETKTYQQNVVSVKRMMPVPYRMDLKLDIYTSNIEQKLQLWEQIAVMFNPSLEIQSTENYIDWTSLSWILLTDTNFSSKVIPIGTDDPIDVATMSFEIPVYITPPAKVTKLNAVTSIVATMYGPDGKLDEGIQNQINQIGSRQWFTPSGYDTIVANGKISLTKSINHGTDSPLNVPSTIDSPIPWRGVVNYIGELVNGVSLMAFVNPNNGNTVIGSISYDPSDETLLLFNVDTSTTPTNTLTAIDRVVDPLAAGPGAGLPAASIGQRYLIINNTIGNLKNGSGATAWKNVDNSITYVEPNKIIQYDGSNWNIVFDGTSLEEEFVTNLYTGIQYKWLNGFWQKSWEGLYSEGYWLLIL